MICKCQTNAQSKVTSDSAKQTFLADKAKVTDEWKQTVEMFKADKAKFEQNGELREFLLATENLLLDGAPTNTFCDIMTTLHNHKLNISVIL